MTSENHKDVEENPVVFFDIKFGAAKGSLSFEQ
jgi:hypothetical protein